MLKARKPSPKGIRGHETGRFMPEVMDSLSDAVIVADIESLRVEYANRSVSDALGYLPEDLVGESIVSLYPDKRGAAAFHQALQDALRNGTEGFRSEQVFARQDGGRTWTEMTTRLVPVDAPEKLVSVLRDITERKLWEDALVRTRWCRIMRAWSCSTAS